MSRPSQIMNLLLEGFQEPCAALRHSHPIALQSGRRHGRSEEAGRHAEPHFSYVWARFQYESGGGLAGALDTAMRRC